MLYNKQYVRDIIKTDDAAYKNIYIFGKLKLFICIFYTTLFMLFLSICINGKLEAIELNRYLGPATKVVLLLGGNNLCLINHGELWRLVTALYLHAGIIHWLCNIIIISILLSIVEPDWGFLRSFYIYHMAGMTGNLASLMYLSENAVAAGASPSAYGLIGAFLIYILEYQKEIKKSMVLFLQVSLFTIASILTGFIFFETIDNVSHLGGFLAGIILSLTTTPVKFNSPDQPQNQRESLYFFSNHEKLNINGELTPMSQSDIEAQLSEKLENHLNEESKEQGDSKKNEKIRLKRYFQIRHLSDTPCYDYSFTKHAWLIKIAGLLAMILFWFLTLKYQRTCQISLYRSLKSQTLYLFPQKVQ